MTESGTLRTQWLERWALYTPAKTAVKDDASGKSYSYADLYAVTNRLSRMFLNRYSIKPGDRVAVLSQNTIEYLFLYFAVQQIGAVLVPVNFRLSAREIEFILSDCSAKLLIIHEQYRALQKEMAAENVPAKQMSMNELPSVVNDSSLLSSPLPDVVKFDDPCMILYT
ncbi:MAG: acyl--CoA ligase, partial [Bacteroidetes bacterium]|nr:acyl--CoA ligase [Bacteroidota bacterium]